MTGLLRTVLRVAAAAGVGGATMASLGCAGATRDGAPGAGAAVASAGADTVIECTAGDIRHVFRIAAGAGSVSDESVTPAKRGVAEVTPAAYRLQFDEPRDHYALLVQVDRASGTGTRQLFDDEQQVVKGHGGTDDIVCTPKAAAP